MKPLFNLLSIVILGIIMLVANTESYSLSSTDTTSTVSVYDDVKTVGGTLYNDAKDAIKQLANALSVGAEHVYTVLVKQQLVHSIVNLLIAVLGLIIWYIVYRLMRYGLSESENAGYSIFLERPAILAVTKLVAFFAFLLTIGVICELPQTVTGFINPEYGAMKDIVQMIEKIR